MMDDMIIFAYAVPFIGIRLSAANILYHFPVKGDTNHDTITIANFPRNLQILS